MHCKILILFSAISILMLPLEEVKAQSDPDPHGAFFRSMVVPGWGHYYADRSDWTRGKYHLGADLVMAGAIVGLNARASRLQDHFFSLSGLRAGVDVSGRSRSFQIAIGEFDSLGEYNDFQLRTRNWHRLIEDIPENRWEWESSEDRRRYRDLRSNRDQIRNQLPALAGFMVVNRVISGISAYNRARNRNVPEITLLPTEGIKGLSAHITITF